MIQDRILKIIKGLNTFSQDDLVIMADIDDKEAEEVLAELLKEEKIIFIGNHKFKYRQKSFNIPVKKQNVTANNYNFTNEELKNLAVERKSLNYLPTHVKLKIDKYLKLLKEVNDIKSSRLKDYINNVWNVKNPEMKSSLTTFKRNRKKLKEIGVKGLIPASIVLSRAASYVDNNIYKAFRKYLSENRDKTLKQNYINFKDFFMETNLEIQEWEFPSYAAITVKISKDSTRLSPLQNTKTEFETFKEAAIHYMEVISQEKKLKP